jgi:hypothetical protein
MPYSIEVHFDDNTNATIRNMWKVISENNIPCRAFEKNFSPHLTLVYGEITGAKKVNWEFLTSQKSFQIEFTGLAGVSGSGSPFSFTRKIAIII